MSNNPALYNAVISGATGANQERWLTSANENDYVDFRSACITLATGIDDAIPPISGGATTSQAQLLQATVQGIFAGRYIQSTSAGDYAEIIGAIVALYNEVAAALEAAPVPATDVAWISRGTGATLRSLYTRDQDAVYATDFMTEAEQTDAYNGTLLFDQQPAIQAAVDYALYKNLPAASSISGGPRIRVPGAVMRLDNPIQVGYGVDFRSIKFEAEGMRYGGTNGSAGSGTAFVPTFDDAPAIVVQGGRAVKLEGFSIFGLNLQYLVALYTTPVMANLLAATWVNPVFPASASSRYAPYAAIAIDPYSGVQPGVHYPAVNYPAFLGVVPQYGKEFSSNTHIKDVLITGFVVGVAQQPCDADGNGDFTKLDNVQMSFCTYGYSWGNSQSRVPEVRNCTFSVLHTIFSSAVFGKQTGKPQFLAVSCAFDSSIKVLDIPTLSYGNGPLLENCFGESLYSLGNVGQGAQTAGAVRFINGEYGFSWWSLYGIPAYVLSNDSLSLVTFEDVLFYLGGTDFFGGLGFKGISSSGYLDFSRGYTFEGVTVVNSAAEPAQIWQKAGWNATGGITIARGSTHLQRYNYRIRSLWNLDNGALIGDAIYMMRNTGPRNRCLPVYGQEAQGLFFGNDPGVRVAWRQNGVTANGAGGIVTQVGRNITFTFTGADTAYLSWSGGDVGDILQCNITGAFFWVYSRAADVISARAMTGFDSAGNLLTPVPNNAEFSATICRHYMPGSVVLYGDFEGGANNITNIVQGDYTPVADIGAYVAVNDYLYVDNEVDQIISPFGDNRITAINNGAQSITLAGNFTAGAAGVHVRLGPFTRPGFPNGTPT